MIVVCELRNQGHRYRYMSGHLQPTLNGSSAINGRLHVSALKVLGARLPCSWRRLSHPSRHYPPSLPFILPSRPRHCSYIVKWKAQNGQNATEREATTGQGATPTAVTGRAHARLGTVTITPADARDHRAGVLRAPAREDGRIRGRRRLQIEGSGIGTGTKGNDATRGRGRGRGRGDGIGAGIGIRTGSGGDGHGRGRRQVRRTRRRRGRGGIGGRRTSIGSGVGAGVGRKTGTRIRTGRRRRKRVRRTRRCVRLCCIEL